ncbi:MAG: glycoside hydrolase 43 family protein [Clostridium sp.]|nr:glycoside hydrolase 43 family protein [Clostridium sp.]
MKRIAQSILMILAIAAGAQGKTYTNPVIYADYSDPDAIPAADGNGYYMTASSFQCTPGVPILFSDDLVNWEIVNYAIDAVPPAEFYDQKPMHGKGVWAPSIRYHNGEYYIYWGDPDFGIYMVKTADPRGEWSKPLLVHPAKGMIDPVPFWDEDGKAYLTFAWAASRSHFNSVLCIWEMEPDGSKLIGKPRIVFDGNQEGNHTCEGPKMYKRDEYYYILCPAGGVDAGWQLAMRSKDIYGPYEAKIVLAQGDTDINGPHQGALVETPQGESWFLHFQELQPWGRIVHLNPVHWEDGWPMMGVNGQPVRKHEMPKGSVASGREHQTSDTFEGGVPGLQWQWHGNYDPTFGMPLSTGAMRIYSYGLKEGENMWMAPNQLLQKFAKPEFTATAKVKVSARDEKAQSGLIVMGRDYARLAASKNGDGFVVSLLECNEAEAGSAENVTGESQPIKAREYGAGLLPVHECELWLRVKVDKDGVCRFSYSEDNKKYVNIGKPFKARPGKWIGAKVGAYSVDFGSSDRGWIDIDEFIVE